MAPAFDAPSRQAALFLRSLGEIDRDWIVSALPTQQQIELRSLLRELQDLGIPEDKKLSASLISLANEAIPPTCLNVTSSALQGLQQLKPVEVLVLAKLLNREPAGLVAKVLGLREWSWRAALLNQLDITQQRRVREQLDIVGQLRARSEGQGESVAFELAVSQILLAEIHASRAHLQDVAVESLSAWARFRNALYSANNYIVRWLASTARRAA